MSASTQLEATPALQLPQAHDLEQGLLGRCLLEGICPTLRPTEWGSLPHRMIHEAMLSLDAEGKPIDMVTVLDELTVRRRDERAGGATYLSALLEMACARSNMEHYERHIKAVADTRRVLLACANIVHRSSDLKKKPAGEWVGELQQVIDEIGSGSGSHRPPEPVSDIVKRVISDLEERRNNRNALLGYPTGLIDLDRQTAGLCPGDLVIIAGRPGMGKTALATQIAATVARTGARVMLFSLEMPREQIQMRILAQMGGVNIKALRTGTLDDRAFAGVVSLVPAIADMDIIIDDETDITELDIKLRVRKYKPDLVLIDYLTLCRAAKQETRRDIEVGNISRGLKAIAKEMQIPVVLLSQLNRAVESRTNKRPMCSDLRDSGAIEQDADLILLLYRDEIYNTESDSRGIAEIIIGKQRNGPTGTIRVRFFEESATFANLSRRPSDG